MSVLTGYPHQAGFVIKVKKHLLLEQNCKEINEHISIVKLDRSDIHKAEISAC